MLWMYLRYLKIDMHIVDSSVAQDCRDMVEPTMVSNENEIAIEPIMGGNTFFGLNFFWWLWLI